MAFPQDPQEIIAELYLGGDWRDITEDVLQRGGFTITRGRTGEEGVAPASRCAFELDNTGRDYNPRNPLGQWYGSIGRNTPCRLLLGIGTDTFARTVSSGWGTSEILNAEGVGLVFSTFASGGTSSNFAVSGGVATHTVTGAPGYRASYLGAFSRRRVDVSVTVSLSFTNVTGAPIEPANILLGGASTSDYHMVRVTITTAEAVTIKLMHADGTDYSDTVTVTGLTHSSGQPLRVRAQLEGAALRAKVWAATSGEPAGWHVSAGVGAKAPARAGWIGIRSGVGSGNTNVPVTFTYDNLVVRDPRYAGEVSTWEPKRDTTGTHRWVPVEASGILRRLSKGGSAPLKSALHRAILSINPIAYWPCEDTAGATSVASGLPDERPMFIHGSPRFASNSDFDCSAPLPVMNDANFDGFVRPHTATGELQLRFLMYLDSSNLPADGSVIGRLYTSGSLWWQLVYGTGGTLKLEGYHNGPGGALAATLGPGAFVAEGKLLRVSIELTQTGGNIDMRISTLEVGQTTGGSLSATAVGVTLGSATQVWMAPNRDLDGTVLGHITVQDEVTVLYDLTAEFNAFVGETAIERIQRLCEENTIPVITHGDPADSTAMGVQRVDNLLSLLTECAEADMGILHEPVGDVGLSYVGRSALYNQTPVVIVSFADHELQPGWEPQEDDRTIVNDVTVRRPDGGSARAVLESGPLSTASPEDGGVGLYDTSETVNVEHDGMLLDVAWWKVTLGTVDEPRFPDITFAREAEAVAANTTLSQALLDLDVGTRLDITDASSVDIYDDVSQIVFGYEEYLNRFNHSFQLNTGPAAPYRILELDDSDLGRLDSTATTLNEDLDTTETSVEVAIETNHALWTTDATEWPFDVETGGEVMTVTAVSGASSPQTFTVTRSVNGVVKSHSAGQQISLARPNRAGL